MKTLALIILSLFACQFSFAQVFRQAAFRIDSLPAEGILLDKGWKWHAGDNPDFAKPDFDDSAWERIDPTKTIHYLPQIRKEPVGWFRLRLRIDSSFLNKPLTFAIYQSIASEIYLNGQLLKKFGTVSQNKDEIKAIQPLYAPSGILFNKTEEVFAVRFSVQPNIYYLNFYMPFQTFIFRINTVWGSSQFNRTGSKIPILNGLHIGAYTILCLIHLIFFFLYKKQKANLFFALATLSGIIANVLDISFVLSDDVAYWSSVSYIEYTFLLTFYNLFLYLAIYQLFNYPRKGLFVISVSYLVLGVCLWFFIYERSILYAFVFPCLFCMIDAIRIAFIAYKKGFKDAQIIIIGF